MKRTQETLKEMSKILTENDKIQEIMGMLAEIEGCYSIC